MIRASEVELCAYDTSYVYGVAPLYVSLGWHTGRNSHVLCRQEYVPRATKLKLEFKSHSIWLNTLFRI
jgi:hypothetical protein